MGRPADCLPRRSPVLCRLFGAYLRGYFRRHFHGVRVARAGRIPATLDGPLLVVVNHPAWWDPLIAFVLARCLNRALHAPMAAAAFARYPLFGRLGMFPIEAGLAGARQFLKAGEAVLRTPRTVLAVTPQGRFADVRERPIRLEPGVGHLIRRVGHGHLLPVALEYPFWTERLPEALVYCGRPIPLRRGAAAEWTNRAAAALGEAQGALAVDAIRRDPDRFELLLGGRSGVGGPYDVCRRLASWARGRWFRPAHDPEGEP